jgi:DNA polymerase-1
MAHFSQDPRMLAAFSPGGSGDVYVDMAVGIFGASTPERRNICKVLVLAMGYGAGDKKVGAILTVNGIPTSTEVGADYVTELHGTYPRFFEWREETILAVHKTGYVQTLGGRHRRLKAQFVDRRNWKNVGYGERQAVNAVIQGSAGDIMARDMVAQQSEFPELDLLVQVHDELVNETFDGWAREQEYGEFLAVAHGFDLSVPLLFEPHVGVSWHEGKEGAPLELPEEYDDSTQDYEEER